MRIPIEIRDDHPLRGLTPFMLGYGPSQLTPPISDQAEDAYHAHEVKKNKSVNAKKKKPAKQDKARKHITRHLGPRPRAR
jgi:hypothetical protein